MDFIVCTYCVHIGTDIKGLNVSPAPINEACLMKSLRVVMEIYIINDIDYR